ncbi:MAG: non-canonical purine NTP pyrophosphatase, RdgB/HAM1 family [Candidatus Pacebacteria bacterium RIFCSPHIGHO2_01_FULL_46_10]|nr:MAG: non-canonical purine NTP pyrophosphatase, RdgB/HAM1 family [Candidatus Pacebacteria bacterium RIFCSPHIGHO2_01_FULL_46_10]
MKILIATHNQGKKKEIQQILGGAIEVLILDNITVSVPEPEETGSTYEENALIKARHAGDLSSLLTIADDSGLEVEALPGELGVKTARYGPGSDADRNAKLLRAMTGIAQRKAKFVSCIVLYDPETKTHHTFLGEMNGHIAEESRGVDGFGFDPVFIPDGYEKTNAELGLEVKNTISHRAKALEKLKRFMIK